MGAVPANILGQIAKAKASAGGNLIRCGVFDFSVKRLLLEKGFKGWSFKSELYVDKAEKVSNVVNEKGEPANIEPNGVGSTASMICNLDKSTSAAGNVKQFLCALLGVDEGSVSDPDFAETLDFVTNVDPKRVEFQKALDAAGNPRVTSDGVYEYTDKPVLDEAGNIVLIPVQPLRGARIHCDTYQRQTKGGPNAGKWGTYPGWTHTPTTESELAANRARLEKTS